jgi:hypothetical protein
MEEIVYPKTMVVMLEIAQAKVKQLEEALQQAQEAVDVWRKIADELVYTEHDVYDYYHRPQFSPCARCVAHNTYHDQVDRESNS